MCHDSGISSEMHSFQPKHGEARYFWMALHKFCVGFLFATKCHCISFLVSFPAWAGEGYATRAWNESSAAQRPNCPQLP